MRSSERLVRRAALIAAPGLAVLLALVVAGVALAADPSPTAAAAGDPRSAGEGPGLVGDPLWAIAIVAAIAVVTVVAITAYVRATAPDRGEASH